MRFSIRDLLLTTVVVALCLAWWLDHLAIRSAMDAVTERLHGELQTEQGKVAVLVSYEKVLSSERDFYKGRVERAERDMIQALAHNVELLKQRLPREK